LLKTLLENICNMKLFGLPFL